MDNFFIGLPHVTRMDLTEKAFNSIKDFPVFCVDNSETGEFYNRKLHTILPATPLTFTQTQNVFIREAIKRDCDWYGFIHNDAETNKTKEFVEIVKEVFTSQPNVGIIFTQYDTLCAFRTEAVIDTGWWDVAFTQYFADNDYYRRLKLAKWKVYESNIPVTHHASITIKTNIMYGTRNRYLFPMFEEYYIKKWGGKPHNERYYIPFNDTKYFEEEKNTIRKHIERLDNGSY